MNDNLDKKLIEQQEKPFFPIELSKEEVEILGSVEDNSMSMEDALDSHKKTIGKVVDAADTARQGVFLDLPEFVCRGIE